jgi:hypothetical protein
MPEGCRVMRNVMPGEDEKVWLGERAGPASSAVGP